MASKRQQTGKASPVVKKYYKSRKDRMLDGVCGGLAEYLHVDSTLIRILWTLSILIGGIGIIVYIIAILIVPINPDHNDHSTGKKTNSGVIWGTILVATGILFLMNEYNIPSRWNFPSVFPFHNWWHHDWRSWISWIFILGGLAIILRVMQSHKRDKEKKDKDQVSPRLFRSENQRMLAGICGGIGIHLKIDPTIIRLIFVALATLTHIFLWSIIYIILIFVIPQEQSVPGKE